MTAVAEPEPKAKPKPKPTTIKPPGVPDCESTPKKTKKRRGTSMLTVSHGPIMRVEPLNTPTHFYAPEEILSSAPICMSELAAYLDSLTNGQLNRGWQATFITVLADEHERLGILFKKEARGLIASTAKALNVIHTRFVRKDDPG